MFVRWKRYERTTAGGATKALLSAQLVQSTRTENGPRQTVMAVLGTIIEDEIGDYWARWRFWRDLRRGLAHNIVAARERIERELVLSGASAIIWQRYIHDPEEVEQMRASIEAKIAQRVPMPTDEDRKAARSPTDLERKLDEEDRAQAAHKAKPARQCAQSAGNRRKTESRAELMLRLAGQ